MSSRVVGTWALVCAATLPGCWESDGFVQSERNQDGEPASGPSGPLGQAISVDGRIDLEGLSAPVDIVRDPAGVIHIYAESREDAFRAQGYAMARDRAVQVELLRRTALGRVAEVFGEVSPETVEQDILMRSLGIKQVAQQEWGRMATTVRPWVAAFADGVSQYFAGLADGTEPLPPAGTAWQPSHFEPFRPFDVFAIDKLVQFSLSFSAPRELEATGFAAGVRRLAESQEPALQRRARILPDLMRFAPPQPSLSASASGVGAMPRDLGAGPPPISIPRSSLHAWRRAAAMVGRLGWSGSNAWALSSERSASGGTVLAADPHFRLSSPAPLWLVHMHVTNASGDPAGPFVAGAALPGVPGVAFGFHRGLAWSPVASYFDVTDVYVEQLDDSASAARFRDAFVPLEIREETVRVAGGEGITFDVRLVPHHGPIIPTVEAGKVAPLEPDGQALSVRWTGLEPTRDLEGALSLIASRGVEQALATVQFAPSAVRSYVVSDPDDIMFVGASHIVEREEGALAWDAGSYDGTLPCLALPGDGRAEWSGVRDGSKVPFSRDPDEGVVVAANDDPTGGTLDNDPSNDRFADGKPAYLACAFGPGFRRARIESRVRTAASALGLAEAASVQGDVRSELAARLVPHLIEALERTQRERETPGTYPSLSEVASSVRFAAANPDARIGLLRSWAEDVRYETLTGVTFADMSLTSDDRERIGSRATLVFHAWLVHVLARVYSDELSAVGYPDLQGGIQLRSLLHLLERQPSALSSFDPELRDSILWDDLGTPALESRDERMVTALLDAIAWLDDHLGPEEDYWRWGLEHTVRFSPFDPSMTLLSIPSESDPVFPDGFPRPGGPFTVDTAGFDVTPASLETGPDFTFDHGPAMRLTVMFGASGPEAMAALAGGQIADPVRANFSDGAEYWRHNASHALVHRREDVLSLATSRMVAWRPSNPGLAD